MKLETFINSLLNNGATYTEVFDLIAQAAESTQAVMLSDIENGNIALTTAMYQGFQVIFDGFMDDKEV